VEKKKNWDYYLVAQSIISARAGDVYWFIPTLRL